jgi:ABC-type glycerol-3-phosphate transport system substrate-binding protein
MGRGRSIVPEHEDAHALPSVAISLPISAPIPRPPAHGTRLTRRGFVAQSLLGATALAGCGRAARAPTDLRVSLPLNAYERAFLGRDVVPPFEREHGARIELVGGSAEDVMREVRAGAPPPDLLAVDLELLGPLIGEGLVGEIDEAWGLPPGETVPGVLPALERGGRRYAVPLRLNVWVSFYNEILLVRAGVTPPARWDDLPAVARALGGIAGGGGVALQGALNGPAAQSLTELIWAFGGDPLAPVDGGALAAGTFLRDLAPALAPLSREAKIDTTTAALASDRVAHAPNWAFVAADLLLRGGKREIAAYAGPAGPAGRARLISGTILTVPRRGDNRAKRELALAFAAYLCSRPIQEAFAGRLAWTPMRRDAFAAAPEWQAGVATAAREALEHGRALPPLRDRKALDGALDDAFREIAFAGVPPRDALDRAAMRVRAVR